MALPSLFRPSRERGLRPAVRTHPFDALQGEMNRLFEDFWRGFDLAPMRVFGEGDEPFVPRVDVEENETEVRVTADLPGLEEKDFELELAGDVLTIRGEKREEREDRRQGWYERCSGSFTRTIPLPCEVEAEKASAEYKKGVLTVRLPKAATARGRGRRIPVQS